METRNMVTKSQIKEALRELGVTPGMKLFVHTSLKQIGWIPGGVQALIEALQEVVTSEGLIMMLKQSTDNSDPKNWSQLAVPEEWWETIRREMLTYDPAKTVTRGIGRVPSLSDISRCRPKRSSDVVRHCVGEGCGNIRCRPYSRKRLRSGITDRTIH
ncbi:AAC(3) family N-acetyltransferase [Exiguobacterium sp. SL14]|nr:AAC(3) family N-acetyltransferase [Exiguobacterium sp. SL14]MCY1691590.1 AAC(3) family N-acetyltransferase [Exiguobacterium sp. SL14]